MKKIFVVIALMAAGVAHAEMPPGMPDTATEMTLRDNCFQSLRGHADFDAAKRGERILRMVAGAGDEKKNGDFHCSAKFELVTEKDEVLRTPWRAHTEFLNGELSDSEKSMRKAINSL